MRQAGLFGLSNHMKRLSVDGDPLEVLVRGVDFEAVRSALVSALAYSDGGRGRPSYDPVVMLKILVLAAQNNVADARMEWLTCSILRDEKKLSIAALSQQLLDRLMGQGIGFTPAPDSHHLGICHQLGSHGGAH